MGISGVSFRLKIKLFSLGISVGSSVLSDCVSLYTGRHTISLSSTVSSRGLEYCHISSQPWQPHPVKPKFIFWIISFPYLPRSLFTTHTLLYFLLLSVHLFFSLLSSLLLFFLSTPSPRHPLPSRPSGNQRPSPPHPQCRVCSV